MRTPRQYLSERYSWLNLADSIAVAVVFVLVIVAIWPHSRLRRPGTGDRNSGLGRRDRVGLDVLVEGTRSDRTAQAALQAGAAYRGHGGAVMPAVSAAAASIKLSAGADVLREPAVDVSGLSEPYPKPAKWELRVVVAIAHLEGDDGHKIEGQLRDAVANLDPRFHVTAVILNRTITLAGRTQGMAHLDAVQSVNDLRVDSLIWGGVKGAGSPAVGPLYATDFGDEPQFGGGYIPGDFKLPELPPDELCKVLRLVIATDSAQFMAVYKIEFRDALVALDRRSARDDEGSRKTAGWSADTRARVNLVLGIATRTSGVELKSMDSLNASIGYIQHALDVWTHDRDPLEWAIVQRNLGRTLSINTTSTMDTALLHSAIAAFQNAMSVYQARSDGIDVAEIQSELGSLYEAIARYEPGTRELK